MAKSGLDYFPLDVNLDDKFALIEAQFGIKGFGVVVKLFQHIYGGQGYYLEWTDDIGLLFARKVGLDYSLVSDIVSASIKRGIFDASLFAKYGVLSSRGIQERYLKAADRRQQVEIKEQYLLLRNIQKYKNVYISAGNVDISDENADIFSQSKLKESKVKETTTTPADEPPSEVVVGVVRLFESIKGQPLSGYECQKLAELIEDYGGEWVRDALKVMADAGKLKLNYAEGILRNWQTNGKDMKPKAQREAEDKKRRREEWLKQLAAEEAANEQNHKQN